VKYANLKLFADRPTILVERCQRLQSEMLLWMSGHRDTAKSFDGTFGSLFDFYERDPESSYQDLKHGVKRTYNIYIRRLHRHIGSVRIDHTDGGDVKRWFRAWRTDPDGSDHLPRARMVLAVMKAAVTFGVVRRRPCCDDFDRILSKLEFDIPASRTFAPTAKQIEAARKAAHAAGKPRRACSTL
jgi:hypothetical protein